MNVRTEMVFSLVSSPVSAGDGVQYDTVQAQPPPLLTGAQAVGASGTGLAVSMPQMTMLEMIRRAFTNITTPSATIVGATSGAAVALTIGEQAGSGGLAGMMQGVPFYISGVGHLSGQLAGTISTTSAQIRKALVTIALSSLPVQSSLASAAGTVLTFVYGSAFATSANTVISGTSNAVISYFDLVPLPMPSAGEIPVGCLNVPNNFPISTAVSA